jgi:hypothetical protein
MTLMQFVSGIDDPPESNEPPPAWSPRSAFNNRPVSYQSRPPSFSSPPSYSRPPSPVESVASDELPPHPLPAEFDLSTVITRDEDEQAINWRREREQGMSLEERIRRERERWLEARRERQAQSSIFLTVTGGDVSQSTVAVSEGGGRVLEASDSQDSQQSTTPPTTQIPDQPSAPGTGTSDVPSVRTAVTWGQAVARSSDSSAVPSNAIAVTWGQNPLPAVLESTQQSSVLPREAEEVDSQGILVDSSHSVAGESSSLGPTIDPPPRSPNLLQQDSPSVSSPEASCSSTAVPSEGITIEPPQPSESSSGSSQMADDQSHVSEADEDARSLSNNDRVELGRRHSLLLSRPLQPRRVPPPVPRPRRARQSISEAAEGVEEAIRGVPETPATRRRTGVPEQAVETTTAVSSGRPAQRPQPSTPTNPSLLTYIPSPDRRSLPEPAIPVSLGRSGSVRALVSIFETGSQQSPSGPPPRPRRRPPPPPPISFASTSRSFPSSSTAAVEDHEHLLTPVAVAHPIVEEPHAANSTASQPSGATDPSPRQRRTLPTPPSTRNGPPIADAYTVFRERQLMSAGDRPEEATGSVATTPGSSFTSSSSQQQSESGASIAPSTPPTATSNSQLRPPLLHGNVSADSVSLQEEERPEETPETAWAEPSSIELQAAGQQLEPEEIEYTDLDLMIANLEGAEDGSRYEVCFHVWFQERKL